MNTMLADWIAAAGPVADTNRAAVGEGWSVGAEFLELHSLALEALSKAAGRVPSSRDRAVLFLGVHGFNVCSALFGLVVRGQFDVAPYMMRALLDCHSLLNGCVRDAAIAEKFLAGEEKLAAPARIKFLEDLKTAGYQEDAAWIERRFKDDYDAVNDLAHIGKSQVQRILRFGETGAEPVLGGRADEDETRLMWCAVLDQEHWVLIALRGLGDEVLGDSWVARFAEGQRKLVDFMKANEPKAGDDK